MFYYILAFRCSGSEEVDRLIVENVLIGVFVNDISLHIPYAIKRSVEELSVNFHASCVKHRAEECILLNLLAEQKWHTHSLQGRDGNQLGVTTVAYTFRCRYSDAQSGIRTGTATYCYSVKMQTVIIDV